MNQTQPKRDDTDEWLIAFSLLLFLLGANAGGILSLAQRKRARKLLRSKFEQDVVRFAQAVAGGAIAPTLWREQMTGSLGDYVRSMAIAGAGTMPSQAVMAAMGQRLEEQGPFLDGFAEQVDTGLMSPLAIAARSKLYGGVAWGGYFLAQGLAAPQNSFEQWFTTDDKFVCAFCAPLHRQVFLAGQGPMPGWGCFGICRCERVPVNVQ